MPRRELYSAGPRPPSLRLKSELLLSSVTSLSVTLKVKLNCWCLVLAGQLRDQKDRRAEMWKDHAHRSIAYGGRTARGIAQLGDEFPGFRMVRRNLFGSLLLGCSLRYIGTQRGRFRRRVSSHT